jgi:hypothetical protein
MVKLLVAVLCNINVTIYLALYLSKDFLRLEDRVSSDVMLHYQFVTIDLFVALQVATRFHGC